MATLFALLFWGLPAAATDEEPTYAPVSAVVTDASGNGRYSRLAAYVPDGEGSYMREFSAWADDGVFSSDAGTALQVEVGREYRFGVLDSRTDALQWVGGDSFEDASVYQVEGDLDLGRITLLLFAVSGRVTRASGGQPLDDVQVSLGDEYYARSKTDGTYAFRDVRPGTYTLTTYHDGYVSSSREIAVTDADVVENLALRSRPRITGIVRNAANEPLRGVTVSAEGEDGGWEQATTRRDGTYSLMVDPGSHRVGFFDRVGDYESQYYDSTSEWEQASLVTVQADESVSGINARLTAAAPQTTEGIDLTGRVVSPDGEPASGVWVLAMDEHRVFASSPVRRDGTYRLDNLESGSYKLYFENGYWPRDFTVDTLPYVEAWSGNKQDSRHASSVDVVADATVPRRYDMTLEQYGLIEGTVRGKAGSLTLDDFYVGAYDEDEDDSGGFREQADRYRILVEPGSYALRFAGHADCDDECVSFVGEWFDNSPTREGARKVVVGSGKVVSGVDAVLTPDLEAVVAPSVTGSPMVGQTLTADTGIWNLMARTTYEITWLRGSTPVGTGKTYRVAGADAGQPLSVRVQAYNGALEALASSAPVMPKHASKTTLAGSSPKKQVVTLKATVSVPGVTPTGTVTFYRGTKAVTRAIALAKGAASATVSAQPVGAQKYHAVYSGNSAIAGGKSAVATVSVKKK